MRLAAQVATVKDPAREKAAQEKQAEAQLRDRETLRRKQARPPEGLWGSGGLQAAAGCTRAGVRSTARRVAAAGCPCPVPGQLRQVLERPACEPAWPQEPGQRCRRYAHSQSCQASQIPPQPPLTGRLHWAQERVTRQYAPPRQRGRQPAMSERYLEADVDEPELSGDDEEDPDDLRAQLSRQRYVDADAEVCCQPASKTRPDALTVCAQLQAPNTLTTCAPGTPASATSTQTTRCAAGQRDMPRALRAQRSHPS